MTQTYADLWLAAVTQKGKDGEGRGRELKRIRNRVRWRVSERECLVLFTRHRRDEQLAMNT